MSSGPFFNSDPILLTLAADQRFGALNPQLDAVWQLSLNPNGPIALETSFGLLVERFRIFPVFLVNNKTISEINAYLSPPRVDAISSNYVNLTCSPAEGVQARVEFWAAESDSLLMRFTLTNTGTAAQNLGIQSAADLCPREGSLGMNPTARNYQAYLLGSSGSFCVAVAHAEPAQAVTSPYPALQRGADLAPGESFAVLLRCCAGFDKTLLEKKLFQAYPENWDAQMARLSILQQADLLRVSTPYADWDAVILSAQNKAFQLLARTEGKPEALLYLDSRSPDNSYAQRADRKDPSALLQPPFEALSLYQLSQALLPIQAQTAAKLFSYKLVTLPDCSRLPVNAREVLPFPCLCANALSIFLQTGDRSFLSSVYARLRQYTLAWFNQEHDLDQDGLPEWLTFSQTGWHNHPSFNFLNTHGHFTWVTSVENLGLGCLLARELDALEQIARVLEDEETSAQTSALKQKLSARLEQIRGELPEASTWDRDTHLSTPHKLFFEGAFADIPRELVFEPPSRVNLKLILSAFTNKPGFLSLLGSGPDGMQLEERIEAGEILRLADSLALTSNQVFARLDSVRAPDLDEKTWTQLYAADLTLRDVGWYLGWPPTVYPENSQPDEQNEDENAFQAYPYGLPEIIAEPAGEHALQLVNPAWNTLVLEHLIQIGAKEQACALFTNLLRGAAGVLKKEHAQFEAWRSADNQPAGRRGAAAGLIPLQAFLDLAGVRVLAPDKVQITGEYPFAWPLTLRYQGLEITRDGKNSTITMPDGTVFHHFGSQAKTFQSARD
ncbi:MAG: hypothetical protein AAGU04_08290 [Anaerolineaceae bacterium]